MTTAETKGQINCPFNPFDEKLVATPHDAYRRLQLEQPIHWNVALQAWVLTRFEDVATILNDSSFSAINVADNIRQIACRAGRDYDALTRFLDAVIFFKNGEIHQQDRRTVAQVLNRVSLSHIEKIAGGIAHDLISQLAVSHTFDVIGDFAEPFPQLVMAYILGIPKTDVPMLSELLAELTLIFDPAALTTYDRLNAKVLAALKLLENRIRQRKAIGAAGLDILYEGTEGDGDRKFENAATTALFVYRVGAETTIGLIGLLIRTLVDRPELRAMAKGRPEIIDMLISEVLRLESNVQRVVRMATRTRKLGGHSIEKGQRLMLVLGAANRDPSAFPSPDEINLEKKRGMDLAFGAGSHFCLGASLARLEARIALNIFFDFPALEKAGPEKWYMGRNVRRLTELPLRVVSPT